MQSSALVATAPPEPATLARLLQQDRAQVQAALARAGLKLRDFQALNGFAAARYLLTCWTGVAVSAVLWLTLPGYWCLLLIPALGVLQHALLNIVHEASHYSLLPDRRWNDRVADLLAALPIGHTVASYRLTHNDHHLYLRTAQDPSSYVTRPDLTRGEIRRTLLFLLGGRLVWELMARSLLGRRLEAEAAAEPELMKATDRQRLIAVAGWQLPALGLSFLLGLQWFWLTWLIVVMTVTPVLDGLRTLVEHRAADGAGRGESAGPAWHTRSHHRHLLVSALMAPFFQYHWEHHLFPGIPHHQLAALHRTLRALDVAGSRPATGGFFGTLVSLL